MTDVSPENPPRGYWIVAGLALLWMLFGVVAWLMDFMMDEAALEQMSEGQRQLYAARPQWVFAVYGVAIFAGLAGAAGLLLRQRWSIAALAVSLLAVIVQFGYTFFVMNAIGHIGAGAALPFPLLILAIGVALLWFASRASRRGWLA